MHGQDRLLRLDQEIAKTIQGIHWPLYAWVLIHTSDLGFAPLNRVSYAAIGAAFLMSGLRLEAALAFSSLYWPVWSVRRASILLAALGPRTR